MLKKGRYEEKSQVFGCVIVNQMSSILRVVDAGSKGHEKQRSVKSAFTV